MTARAPATALLALAALLAGCAAVPTGEPSVSGRLSLQVAGTDGRPARGFNAAFDMRGTAEAGELRLSTPLGPQIAAARWAPGSVSLQTADGDTRFDNLQALSIELLGEALPLQALPDWLRARPWPGAGHTPQGDGFVQLGWVLDLSRRGDGFLVATRSAPPAVTLRVRLEAP